MNYIDKMNAVITAKEMSIRKLSQSCNLSERGIYKILNKIGNPSVSSIEQLCEALGIRIADLFCEKDENIVHKGSPEMLIIKTFDVLSQEAQNRLLWIADKLKGH